MNCLEIRDLLAELAVGVLPVTDREEVERHLRWCAGCRKEVAELGQAAASLGFALAPATVPSTLGERVVERVKRTAGAPGTPRRARSVAASIAAAMVAVASLGWGAAMAGRADRFEARAEAAEQARADALAEFQRILASIVPVPVLPEEQTHLGRLAPTAAGARGGGAVLQLVSPNLLDFTIVIVNGLDPSTGPLPYRIRLVNAAGEVLRAGRIDLLDADGGAEAYHEFDSRDLTGFTTVRIVDADGRVVLVGEIDQGGDEA